MLLVLALYSVRVSSLNICIPRLLSPKVKQRRLISFGLWIEKSTCEPQFDVTYIRGGGGIYGIRLRGISI